MALGAAASFAGRTTRRCLHGLGANLARGYAAECTEAGGDGTAAAWRRIGAVVGAAGSGAIALLQRRGSLRSDALPLPSELPYRAPPDQMGFTRAPLSPDSIAARQCRVEAKSFGKGAGRVTCTNPTGSRQRVSIPRGYMFQPEAANMQTLICERDLEFWVEPGQSATHEFDAFCGYSKGAVPHGPMRATGLQAPPAVLQSQQSVWQWTRPWERQKPPTDKKQGIVKSLWSKATHRAAVDDKKVLQNSYGIDAKKHRALKETLAGIDKDPKRFQHRGGSAPPAAQPAAAKPAAPPPPASAAAQGPGRAPAAPAASAGAAGGAKGKWK